MCLMMDCALFEDQKEKQTYREFNLSEKTQRTCAGAHTHTHTPIHAHTHVHHMCHLSSCSNTHAHTCTTCVICHHAQTRMHTHTHTHTLQAPQARLPHCRRKGEGYEWTAVTENCRFSLAPCSRRFLQQEAELRKGSPPSPRRETRMAMIPGVP